MGYGPQFLLPILKVRSLVCVGKDSSLPRGVLKRDKASEEPHPCGKPEPGVDSNTPPKKSPENPDVKKPQFPPEKGRFHS